MNIKDIDDQAKNNPLSKDELKKQFIEKTKELGLKHSFTFDEAWEIGQEIRKRQDYREKITNLHNQMVEVGGITGDELNE